MTALIIIAYILLHFVIGGFAYAKIQTLGRAKCTRYNCNSDCGHSALAGLSIVLWPITGPAMLGGSLGFSTKEVRTEARREREIEEAQHQARLAELKATEHAALDKELALLERKQKYDLLNKE